MRPVCRLGVEGGGEGGGEGKGAPPLMRPNARASSPLRLRRRAPLILTGSPQLLVVPAEPWDPRLTHSRRSDPRSTCALEGNLPLTRACAQVSSSLRARISNLQQRWLQPQLVLLDVGMATELSDEDQV
jgi:hypothetical protein